jgi:hypothetical protein
MLRLFAKCDDSGTCMRQSLRRSSGRHSTSLSYGAYPVLSAKWHRHSTPPATPFLNAFARFRRACSLRAQSVHLGIVDVSGYMAARKAMTAHIAGAISMHGGEFVLQLHPHPL